LLDEAFVLLDREEPDGVTIRAVARAAGVSIYGFSLGNATTATCGTVWAALKK
jgi:hypothetical protein